jgi:hypothetical protein
VGAVRGQGRRLSVRQPHGGLAAVLQDSLAADGSLSATPLVWMKQACADGCSGGIGGAEIAWLGIHIWVTTTNFL